jgi:5-methylthioadenosine/S-adenosylhomocysteine deaminase
MEKAWLTRGACIALVAILLTLTGSALTASTVTTDQPGYVLRGTLVTPDRTFEGELVITGDSIACVAVYCDHPAGTITLDLGSAYILPGFVDSHNHVSYNVLPKWTPPHLYSNRYRWRNDPLYKSFSAPYHSLLAQHLYCEMVKYSKIKSLISGVTTIQGTYPPDPCVAVLIRSAENWNGLELPQRYIETQLDVDGKPSRKIDWNVTKAFVIHLAEGVDEDSRKEFELLKKNAWLRKQTVIIHGTGLGESEFRQMARVGAKLIWSPQSNFVLYGRTTNVRLALQVGVHVSLAPDWYPTGSNDIFEELRVAAEVNRSDFRGAIPDSDWIRMITVNPAEALALDSYIGRLKPGLKADITILRSQDPNPSRSLLRSHLEDVRLVWVGGRPLYGDEALLGRTRSRSGTEQCERLVIHGSKKLICVSDPTSRVDKGSETLAQITSLLEAAYSGLSPIAP